MSDEMDVEHEIAKLLVQLGQSQADEIGDGTTGIGVLSDSLLKQAKQSLDRGLLSFCISDCFNLAVKRGLDVLSEISDSFKFSENDKELLKRAALTALGSEIVRRCQIPIAEIAMGAPLAVVDLRRRDVDSELIKVERKADGRLEDWLLVKSVIIHKDFSHPKMPRIVEDARMAILTRSF
ncbi:T-complex protein 1 subunit epsilon [Fasciola gigantica]|uniref:T-complex protein 1 subunit epsilon n=1 Tax=Fasciola gigantica TaxID=46835 RepID=A0A504ZCN5_FASGI|nr:T-complex protein 1 subunit epsilon [Fasciola gigantica]